MASNRFALAGLVVACVGAAGVGGYLATKHGGTGMADQATAAAMPAPGAAVPASETTGNAPVSAPPAVSSTTRKSIEQGAAPTRPQAEASVRAARPQVTGAASARPAEPVGAQDRGGQPVAIPAPVPAPQASSQVDAQAPAPRADERPVDVPRAAEPPARKFEELVVAADSVIGLQTETALSSDRSRVEDKVEAHVIRGVRVGNEIAIPSGTRALGTVVSVERGGKFKERARLGIRFQTLLLADGTRLPITTETIYRFGNAPGNASAARIGGGAVIGAIVGGIVGGGKGAAIGATAGAGAGTASVMSGEPNPAAFPAGAEVTARFLAPVTITIEKE